MRVSVCITSYNQVAFLEKAIDSVLGQTINPFEIIIIDDFSSDGSRELVTAYQEKYPQLVYPILNEHNMKVSASRTKALEAVRGDCVTFLDGDDVFYPAKLEQEIAKIVSDKVDIVYSNHDIIDVPGNVVEIWAENKDTMPEGDVFVDVLTRAFPKNRIFRAEMVRYPLWQSIGFYDSAINLYEDYDMKVRLSKKAKVAYADYIGSSYRLNPEGLSRARVSDHRKVVEYIFKKNAVLVENLNRQQIERVSKFQKKFLSQLYTRELRECVGKNDLLNALLTWLRMKLKVGLL